MHRTRRGELLGQPVRRTGSSNCGLPPVLFYTARGLDECLRQILLWVAWAALVDGTCMRVTDGVDLMSDGLSAVSGNHSPPWRKDAVMGID
jgi:hypothetical protein